MTTLRKKPLENLVGKGENAGNQHFLLFPQCFLLFTKQVLNLPSLYFVVCKYFQFGQDILLFGNELSNKTPSSIHLRRDANKNLGLEKILLTEFSSFPTICVLLFRRQKLYLSSDYNWLSANARNFQLGLKLFLVRKNQNIVAEDLIRKVHYDYEIELANRTSKYYDTNGDINKHCGLTN